MSGACCKHGAGSLTRRPAGHLEDEKRVGGAFQKRWEAREHRQVDGRRRGEQAAPPVPAHLPELEAPLRRQRADPPLRAERGSVAAHVGEAGRNPSSRRCRRGKPGRTPCQKSNGKAPFGKSSQRVPPGASTRACSARNATRWASRSGLGATSYRSPPRSSTPTCSSTPEHRIASNAPSRNGRRRLSAHASRVAARNAPATATCAARRDRRPRRRALARTGGPRRARCRITVENVPGTRAASSGR